MKMLIYTIGFCLLFIVLLWLFIYLMILFDQRKKSYSIKEKLDYWFVKSALIDLQDWNIYIIWGWDGIIWSLIMEYNFIISLLFFILVQYWVYKYHKFWKRV